MNSEILKSINAISRVVQTGGLSIEESDVKNVKDIPLATCFSLLCQFSIADLDMRNTFSLL